MKKISTMFMIILFLSCCSYSQPLGYGYDKFLGNVEGSSPISPLWDTYWNQISPENAGKWGSVEGTRDSYSWGGMDAEYNYGKQRGILVKFHCLVWGNQQPSWITTLPANEQLEEVEEWIRLVGERYPDLDMIDVVNEPLPGHAPAPYREALGGAGTTGWDWIVWAFQKARQYLPHTKLILNEYNVINSNTNTDALLKIVKILQERGLIDAIGIQAHRFETENTAISYMTANLDKLGNTGLPVYLTEFDLGNIGDSGSPNDAVQLQLYQKIFPVLWEHPAIKGITFWGYLQGQMWQTTAYLIRTDGTERPAMQWLRNYLTFNGSYRSFQSGNWGDLNTWESFNGQDWVHPADAIPSSDKATIKISEGHTVNVESSAAADQLYIASGGSLVINPNVSLQINDAFGEDATIAGSLRNLGAISKTQNAEIKVNNGGTYIHEIDGGLLPDFNWVAGSTIQFTSIVSTQPSNLNQNFSNIIWNCPLQTNDVNLGWKGNTISGDVTIQNTGTGVLYLCAPSAGESDSVTILGDVVQSGGNFSTNNSSNGNTSIKINHNGNLEITGGNFFISRGSQGGTGTTVWNLNAGNFTMSNATVQNFNPTGAKFTFSKKAAQIFSLGSGNTIGSLPVEILNGTTLNMGASVLEGNGSFTLNPGATLETSHPEGINGNLKNTGTNILSTEGGYSFSGTAAQVTGNLMPDAVNNLTVNNSALSLTLSKPVTINGTLNIKSSGLNLGGNQLTFGVNSTLEYSGSTAQTTSDIEFPVSGPKNLVISNIRGVTLHASRSITGNIDVGGRLYLGNSNLSAALASSRGITRYIVTDSTGGLTLTNVGSVETLFPLGVGNSAAPVWITNNGTADIITVRAESDASVAAQGGRVKVKWIINEANAGGGDYYLKFGWVTTLEDNLFKADREGNAFIFNLADTVEAGSGPYFRQMVDLPHLTGRGGITVLGPFSVGKFGFVTGVKDELVNIPDEFNLSQNYPNPFNPSTVIKYSIPQQSNVKITVYNILGNKVKTLVNTFKTAGEYSITWNATDESNNSVSSGIYFYSFETDKVNLQRKMLFLK